MVGVGCIVALAWCCLPPTVRAGAQSDFDVVSVRPNLSNQDGGIIPEPGRFMAVNVPLSQVLRYAFRLPSYRIVGLDKLGKDRYDIVATYADKQKGSAEIGAMVQRLLSDRFSLRTRTEARRTRVYRLVRVRKDGAPGPQLKPTKVDCAARQPDQPGPCGIRMPRGRYVATGIQWSQGSLVSYLGDLLERPVIDQTGLSGQFDIDLSWRITGADPSPDELGKPTLFTALQDQLGLKLEQAEDAVEFLIIEHSAPPSQN